MDVQLPPQRKTFKSKNKAWRKDCINAMDTATSLYNNDNTRRRVRTKIINQELYEGLLNMQDMTQMINPYNVVAETIPTNIVHHPIVVPKIDLLVGEEAKAPFAWSVMIGDRDGISSKQEERKKIVDDKISELIDKDGTEEEIQAELENFEIYLKHEWKDMREVRATKLLKHYWRELGMEAMFVEGFKDSLIHGEEIYQCSILDGEPLIEKLNPIKVHTIRGGYASKIEDADIIVIEDHWSPGRVIDTWGTKMNNEEIDRVSKGYVSKYGSFDQEDYRNSFILSDRDEVLEGYLRVAEIEGHKFNRTYVDNDGNVRVLQCFWSSLKLAYKVKYFDEYGDVQYKMTSEEYIPDPAKGETVEKMWVREWWKGVKVGNDIYPSIEPMPVQYARMSNPSKAHPGIVGEIYNTNQGRSTSMMDRMKNYQYLYDILWDRLNKSIAKNQGKIMEMDMAKIPKGWNVHKWMNYATKFGYAFVDSFKEGVSGSAQGKLAGNFNTTGKVLDLETGNYIQQHINLLEYVKAEMSEIIGVTPQRQGAISSSETVGGVERSVMQSSNTTAWLFKKHENVKIRAMSIFLETAKVALKGNKKKLQNILDDFSMELFEIDGDEFSEMDYGIFVTSDLKTREKEQLLNQAAHAFMQNSGKLGVVMDIMFSDSITEKMRKIEIAEQKIDEQQQEQAQQAQVIAQQQIEANAADKQAERELKQYEIDSNNSTKLLIEQLKQQGATDELESKETMSSEDRMIEIKKMQADIEMNRDKIKAQRTKQKVS